MSSAEEKRNAFLKALAEAFETKDVIDAETVLSAYAWDSLAHVLVIGIVDEIYGKQLDGDALAACVTVCDLLLLAEAP